MVNTSEDHGHDTETFDILSGRVVLAVVLMFVSMLAASSHRQDVVSKLRERVALLHPQRVDTGWVPVDGVMRTYTYPDSLERIGPDTYRFVLRFRITASYYAYTHEEVDCRQRMTRTTRSRRVGIRNDSTIMQNAKWTTGRRNGVTQRKLASLCQMIARR